MLMLIAWRNVWRNKKRSLIIIAAITVGLWAGLFSMALSFGVVTQMVESSIATRLSHVQIHQPGFLQHMEIGLTIPSGDSLLEALRRRSDVTQAAGRTIIGGMASSPATASGVVITGVTPADEKLMTDIHNLVIEGTYFEPGKRNPAVIGEKLAQRLGTKTGGKIVVTAQDQGGDLAAGAFRVVGIYRSSDARFDETMVFVEHSDLDRIFDLKRAIHEIAMLTVRETDAGRLRDSIKVIVPDLAVETWKDISPELALITESTSQQLYIFLIIILLALVFGITNTMLMGVIERTRELGVAMALGMKGSLIFAMIFCETMFLAILGGVFGIALGAGTIAWLGQVGLDLSLFAEGLSSFGMGSIWYPTLRWQEYPVVVILVIITAFVSALYPGIRAVRLRPVEAIRSY